jgi:hypothetical protein
MTELPTLKKVLPDGVGAFGQYRNRDNERMRCVALLLA